MVKNKFLLPLWIYKPKAKNTRLRLATLLWTCRLLKFRVNLGNIFLFFLLVIFGCKVGDNVSESEAIYCAVSFKCIKCGISPPERVLSEKVLVLISENKKFKSSSYPRCFKWVRLFLFIIIACVLCKLMTFYTRNLCVRTFKGCCC